MGVKFGDAASQLPGTGMLSVALYPLTPAGRLHPCPTGRSPGFAEMKKSDAHPQSVRTH